MAEELLEKAPEEQEYSRKILEVNDTDRGYDYYIAAGTSTQELAAVCGFLARVLKNNGMLENVKDFTDMVVQYSTNDMYKQEGE